MAHGLGICPVFGAFVEGGYFRSTTAYGCAQAREIMSTKSLNDYRWFVTLIKDSTIGAGIATEWISFDENAIWTGNEVLKGTTTKAKSGEPLEIHFKFQPKLKKLTISLVSSKWFLIIREGRNMVSILNRMKSCSCQC